MRLTPDQKEQNIAALRAVMDGGVAEVFICGEWKSCNHVSGIDSMPYRPKPLPPVARPWSFNTRPREVVWVWMKGRISDRMITAWCDDGVEVGSYAKVSYDALLLNWNQRDGSPCGTTEAP